MELTDEDLMRAYADDDMEAFQALYQRHKSRIFGFLMAKLRDRTEAEEVFQTVFVKLHAARGKYRPEIPFLPWVFTISRNALIDHVRKRDAHRRHIITSDVMVETYAEPVRDGVDEGLALEELSRLTEAQRRALELRFSQGLTFEEIAERMDTSAGNARQIISRAVRRLRQLMTGKEASHERS